MFIKKNKKDKLSRYVDPTGEFTSKELKISVWYVEHKLLLQKIGIGVLIAWCVVTVGYSLLAWGNYLIFGYFADQEMLAQQRLELLDYEAIQPLYKAADLRVVDTNVFHLAEDRYDFVSLVSNPNERWLARLTYKYVYSGGETQSLQTILLPKIERPAIAFGQYAEVYPTSVKLIIENVEWRRINPHVIFNVDEYIQQRLKFDVDNFSFTQANRVSAIPAHRIEFDLYNNSAYSYWEPEFYVELFNNKVLTGVIYLSVEEFQAGEIKPIDLRTVTEQLAIDEILVIPVVNIFDSEVYMEPGD